MSSAEAYRGLVERLQVEARESPRRYKLKLALLAALGFAVLGSVLGLAFGLPIALAAYLLGTDAELQPQAFFALAVPLAFGVSVLHALWLRIEVPAGYRLRPDDAPALQTEVERLRLAIGAPVLEGIVIDAELNAAAANVPRVLGLFGHRHYLVLGLPLMQLLDRAELASVIAHEFGHFGAGHGRFSGWIYRLRASWYRLLGGLAVRNFWTARIFAAFFDWYAPYFNAYSFVLARSNEYQADAAAVHAEGAEAAASALIRVELATQRLDRDFWPRVRARSRAQPRPPVQVYGDMADALRHGGQHDVSRLLATSKADSDLEDTHPALPQRLAAMGAAPLLRDGTHVAAAQEMLGDLAPMLEQRFNDEWRHQAEADWLAEYSAATAQRARLEALEGRLSLTPAEAVEHARLVDELRPDFDAMPLYLKALADAPDNALAHYRLGLLEFGRGAWRAGIARLRRSMELDVASIPAVIGQLRERAGDTHVDADAAAEMHALQAEFAAHADLLKARDAVAADDALLPHDLAPAHLRTFAETLARFDKVGRAWVARKQLREDEGLPHYAVLVTWRGTLRSEAAGLERVVQALMLPGSFTVFTGSEHKVLARRVKQACGEPVYRNGAW